MACQKAIPETQPRALGIYHIDKFYDNSTKTAGRVRASLPATARQAAGKKADARTVALDIGLRAGASAFSVRTPQSFVGRFTSAAGLGATTTEEIEPEPESITGRQARQPKYPACS